MFSSKVFYMIAGFDMGFALVSAMLHDSKVILFVLLAMLMTWVGDRRRADELQGKGE